MSDHTRYRPEWVKLERFCELTGYTEDAVRLNRKRGIWPDGIITQIRNRRIHVNLRAYDQWVAGVPKSHAA